MERLLSLFLWGRSKLRLRYFRCRQIYYIWCCQQRFRIFWFLMLSGVELTSCYCNVFALNWTVAAIIFFHLSGAKHAHVSRALICVLIGCCVSSALDKSVRSNVFFFPSLYIYSIFQGLNCQHMFLARKTDIFSHLSAEIFAWFSCERILVTHCPSDKHNCSIRWSKVLN